MQRHISPCHACRSTGRDTKYLRQWHPTWQPRGSWCTTLSCLCKCLAGAAELRGDLEHATRVELPATLAFDYPTPADAAAMLAVRMASAVAHTADASIVEQLEPAAHTLALQQAFAKTGISGNIWKITAKLATT